MSNVRRIPPINPVDPPDWVDLLVVIIVDRSWAWLAGQVLQSWSMVLRLALLLTIVLAGAVLAGSVGVAH